MGRSEQKTEKIFQSEEVAGNSKKVFSLRGGLTGAAIQVSIVEACLSVSTFVDEDIDLADNSYVDVAHGFETGLKGVLAAVVACCAVAQTQACWTISGGCCNIATVTEAAHGLTTGERGIFTTSGCCEPAGLCDCGVYFAIDVTACTYRLAATRALALSGCSIAVTTVGCGTHTFTPNGLIPTGSTACSFIIKIDDDTYKLATSKVNAEAGTVDTISVLNSPASYTFTACCVACCTNGVVTIRYSVNDETYVIDAGAGLLDCTGIILDAGLTVIDNADGLHYNSIEVDVDVTDSQWIVNIDVSGKS